MFVSFHLRESHSILIARAAAQCQCILFHSVTNVPTAANSQSIII